jgi:hypothetical protein
MFGKREDNFTVCKPLRFQPRRVHCYSHAANNHCQTNPSPACVLLFVLCWPGFVNRVDEFIVFELLASITTCNHLNLTATLHANN